MSRFFSPSTKGFYDNLSAGIPDDAIEISEYEYSRALKEQSSGRILYGVGADGVIDISDRPALTKEQVSILMTDLVRRHMDESARAFRYDSIEHAITFAEEDASIKFQSEGRAFRAWRSLTREKLYEIIDEVQSGTRKIPTDEELISELPELDV